MARIRRDMLDAIVDKTDYSERHVRRMIDKLIEASGYTIPNKRIGANVLASKLSIKVNEILDADELAEVRSYLSEPVVKSIQIQVKGKRRKTIKTETASIEERIRELVEENRRLKRNIEQLKADIEKMEPSSLLEKITI